jgi:hypothetical protein
MKKINVNWGGGAAKTSFAQGAEMAKAGPVRHPQIDVLCAEIEADFHTNVRKHV